MEKPEGETPNSIFKSPSSLDLLADSQLIPIMHNINSWSKLILQKDKTVFGSGQRTHNNLPDDIADMPTEKEITDNKVVAWAC
ncbi:hypothetical protein VP01_427g3 [Puccinia sorghi]|uniref:Uncharacterized protein n=1 Tax=Puccinia sorghi TaxID=27349 RepID=A0A0L6UR34_9BASI|nr:hypothetical protein VP01_427g3 [Puccinia sorghi]